jgi:hypothetical protein
MRDATDSGFSISGAHHLFVHRKPEIRLSSAFTNGDRDTTSLCGAAMVATAPDTRSRLMRPTGEHGGIPTELGHGLPNVGSTHFDTFFSSRREAPAGSHSAMGEDVFEPGQPAIAEDTSSTMRSLRTTTSVRRLT